MMMMMIVYQILNYHIHHAVHHVSNVITIVSPTAIPHTNYLLKGKIPLLRCISKTYASLGGLT